MEEQILQLQQELKLAKEERSEALQELEEIKWKMYAPKENSKSSNKMEIFAAEAEKAKESERRMLESLACQTKQLEQTKIMLEEAKLDIKSLNDTIKVLEGSLNQGGKAFAKSITFGVVRNCDEIGTLRTELKLAWQAEEKSKKAMDDLALALKEVTMDLNRIKEKLAETQSELGKMKYERDELKAQLNRTEVQLRLALDESRMLKLDAEESFLVWIEKENGFINCMKLCEEDVINLQQENDRLVDSQRSAKEEISRLRDILKQAINEANVVKEALEIARTENSQLKDMIPEKDKVVQYIKQELEGHKSREAAAVDRVKELESLLVETSSMEMRRKSTSFEKEIYRSPKAPPSVARVAKAIAKFPSENWSRNPYLPNDRRFSLGDSDRYDGSIFDIFDSPEQNKEKTFVKDKKKNGKGVSFDQRESQRQIDGSENSCDSPTRMKKKKQLMRKFGELLRKRSFTMK